MFTREDSATMNGNYNLKYTVCHNTKTDRTSYSSRCEQQRATVQSWSQTVLNKFGKHAFKEWTNRPQYRDKQSYLKNCMEIGLAESRSRFKTTNLKQNLTFL